MCVCENMSMYLSNCGDCLYSHIEGAVFPFGDQNVVLLCYNCARVSQEIGQGEGEVTVIVCL